MRTVRTKEGLGFRGFQILEECENKFDLFSKTILNQLYKQFNSQGLARYLSAATSPTCKKKKKKKKLQRTPPWEYPDRVPVSQAWLIYFLSFFFSKKLPHQPGYIRFLFSRPRSRITIFYYVAKLVRDDRCSLN